MHLPYPSLWLTAERPYVHVGPFRLYISDRLMEWFAAFLMLGDSIVLTGWRVSVPGEISGLSIQPSTLAVFFAMFGAVRTFALFANGNIPIYGPRARALCAFAAAPVWALLAMAQFGDALAGRVSLGLPVYVCLTLCEIASAVRATYDVGRI